jgi:hypothetical protein
MTKKEVQLAIQHRIPFVIKMADGEKYDVSDRFRIAVGNTSVILITEDDAPHMLPLLTMTGISYLKSQR